MVLLSDIGFLAEGNLDFVSVLINNSYLQLYEYPFMTEILLSWYISDSKIGIRPANTLSYLA